MLKKIFNDIGSKYSRYLFFMPALIYMLLLVGYPIVYNIILSFQDVTVKTLNNPVKEFVSFKNYITLFQDGILLRSIYNSLLFTVACLIFQFIIGFALALLFNKILYFQSRFVDC